MIAGFEFTDFDAVHPALLARADRIGGDVCSSLALVARRCAEGSAMCLVGADGVVVVAPDPQPDGTMRAMVLLAVSSGRFGAFCRQEAALLAIARELGAAQLAFKTDRPGWSRLLGVHWSRHGDIYARDV